MASVGRMKLGSQGLEVSAQGLGCLGMSAFYGPPKPKPHMITLIHHAVRSGITFLDTSDMYGPFTNEILLGKALKGLRKEVELATKFGISNGDGRGKWEIRGDPTYVRTACEACLMWTASTSTTSIALIQKFLLRLLSTQRNDVAEVCPAEFRKAPKIRIESRHARIHGSAIQVAVGPLLSLMLHGLHTIEKLVH